MAQPLLEPVEQFCTYQRTQKGKTEGGVSAYRWMLGRFLALVRKREARLAHAGDPNTETIQAWMDDMASADLAVGTMRVRGTLPASCRAHEAHLHRFLFSVEVAGNLVAGVKLQRRLDLGADRHRRGAARVEAAA